MRRIPALVAVLASLPVVFSGCAARGVSPDPPQTPEAELSGKTSPGDPGPPSSEGSGTAASEGAASTEAAEPDYSDPDTVMKTFFAPYGTLIYRSESWDSYEDLGPDVLFQFTVQANYHLYMDKADYAERYGPEFQGKQPPLNAEGMHSYPAGEVEETALRYFGAPAEYLRSAASYLPDEQAYRFQYGGFGETAWPSFVSSEREGDLLRITYDVATEEMTCLDAEGEQARFPSVKYYTAVMTVKLLPGGGFSYQSVEVEPGSGIYAPEG